MVLGLLVTGEDIKSHQRLRAEGEEEEERVVKVGRSRFQKTEKSGQRRELIQEERRLSRAREKKKKDWAE